MNCKPGDLAIITNAMCTENIGKIVTVLRRHKDHELLGPAWEVGGEGISAVVGFESGKRIPRNTSKPAVAIDKWLRPVSGLPVHDEVTDEVTA